MKKLNLAMIAPALIFSFVCQKEIETTNNPNTTNSTSEDINIVLKCTPDNPTWFWFDNNGTSYQIGDYCCVPDSLFYANAYGMYGSVFDYALADSISYVQVDGLPDKNLLIHFFEIIENYQNNYPVISSFITANKLDLYNYFDKCIIDNLENHTYHPKMHLYGNINGGGYLEYLKIFENSTLQDLIYVCPVNLH